MRRRDEARPIAIEISTNTKGVEESHDRAARAAEAAAEAAKSAAAAAATLELIAQTFQAPRQHGPKRKNVVILVGVYVGIGLGLAAAQIFGWLDAVTVSAIGLFLTPTAIAIAIAMYYLPAKDS